MRAPVGLRLRAYILLRAPIASDASGLCCRRSTRRRSAHGRCSARRRGWARRIVARAGLGRLGEPRSTPAAAARGLRLLLRRGRGGSRRRRVPRHGRGRRPAGGPSQLPRRGAGRLWGCALRGHVWRGDVRRGPRRGDMRRRARSGRRVRCRRRVRSGSRASCRGRTRRRRSSRFPAPFLRLRGCGCRQRSRNDKNCRDACVKNCRDACVPLEHDTTSWVARMNQRRRRRAGFAREGATAYMGLTRRATYSAHDSFDDQLFRISCLKIPGD